ncbi:MAG TPA: sulfite exporter TauE/SafE family protein [Xanthobacteraceae bacterium]|nr:sulfite exporter TauE/SafE family protein [Xanthobacteraceae bacterium]
MNGFLLIAGAGLIAGAMNALAGGGSFVSLPALIAAGVPSVAANASSTVALFPGGAASAWAYRDGLGPVGAASLKSLLLTTLAGGAIGAMLLLRTPVTIFDVVLPWLLLLATLVLGLGQTLGERLRRRWHIRPAAVLIIQFALAIYGGYFGGAVGIMMMAVWGLLDSRELKSLNAPRTLLVSAANAVAVLTFILAQAVHWHETIIMLVAATLGGYGGAQLGRRAPAKAVRAGTVLLTSLITLAFFARAYLKMPT